MTASAPVETWHTSSVPVVNERRRTTVLGSHWSGMAVNRALRSPIVRRSGRVPARSTRPRTRASEATEALLSTHEASDGESVARVAVVGLSLLAQALGSTKQATARAVSGAARSTAQGTGRVAVTTVARRNSS